MPSFHSHERSRGAAISDAGPMTLAQLPRWRTAAVALTAISAAIPIILFLITAINRLRYPFLLEQLEGPMLLAAERIAKGLPIYVRPNFTFIPYMYAPAYYYISGWLVRLLGPGFLALRLLSLLSTIAGFAVIYMLVFFDAAGTRARRHLAALAGAGLYAAMYPWTGNWYDLARVDSFYILLLLIALACTRRLHPVLAAIAWTAVFLAKQTILPLGLILLSWQWKRPRRMLFGAGSLLLMAAIATRLLDHATHGWFWFYAFTVPHANADLLARPAVFFLPSLVFAPLGIGLIIVALAWRRWKTDSAERLRVPLHFYLLAAGSAMALCWFLQAHGGATRNTPMPFYATFALLFGISFGNLDASLARDGCPEWVRLLLLVAVSVQLVSWLYSPHDSIPQPPLLAADQELSTWIQGFPGDVFVPASPYLAVQAGKSWHPDIAALHDSLRPENTQFRRGLLDEIQAEIDQEKFDAIVLDGTPAQVLGHQTWLPSDLLVHYPIAGFVPGFQAGDPFVPHSVVFLLPCREQARAVTEGWTLFETHNRLSCR